LGSDISDDTLRMIGREYDSALTSAWRVVIKLSLLPTMIRA